MVWAIPPSCMATVGLTHGEGTGCHGVAAEHGSGAGAVELHFGELSPTSPGLPPPMPTRQALLGCTRPSAPSPFTQILCLTPLPAYSSNPFFICFPGPSCLLKNCQWEEICRCNAEKKYCSFEEKQGWLCQEQQCKNHSRNG